MELPDSGGNVAVAASPECDKSHDLAVAFGDPRRAMLRGALPPALRPLADVHVVEVHVGDDAAVRGPPGLDLHVRDRVGVPDLGFPDLHTPHGRELPRASPCSNPEAERRARDVDVENQTAVMPPSAAHTAPVTYGAWSDARNAITAATSSGSPARPSGMPRKSVSASAGVTQFVIGVCV